jgi:hypothetical protein
MGSVVEGDQRPLDRFADHPVVPDAHGHSQQPLGNPGVDALGGAAAVAFEVEPALENVVDRFDPLLDPADRPVPGRLVLAVGADQAQPEAGGDQVLEAVSLRRLVTRQPADPGSSGRTCSVSAASSSTSSIFLLAR